MPGPAARVAGPLTRWRRSLAFRHLLEQNDLGDQIFEAVKAHLNANGMAMRQGTIIDATIIAVPSSTLTEAAGRAWRSP
jgi:IS5 family transposase